MERNRVRTYKYFMEGFKNSTQTELDNDLKQDYYRDKEVDDHTNDIFMQKVMEKIEKRRELLITVFPIYTQKYVAKEAGISISTYKNYLSGYNTGFTLRTLLNIADTLGCKPSDFLD